MSQVYFYKTTELNNKITKELGEPTIIDCNILSNIDLLQPTITLNWTGCPEFNYCYIPSLNRYYYINSATVKNVKLYTLRLFIDVLYTYKDEILECYGNLVKTSDGINNYVDTDYPVEVRKEVDVYKSTVAIEEGNTNILITLGGGA